MRRAAIVLAVAVAAHVWVVRSPQPASGSAVASTRETAAIEATPASERTDVAPALADAVRVLHTLSVARPLESEWPRPKTPGVVGTSGLVAASYTQPLSALPLSASSFELRPPAPVVPTPVAFTPVPSPSAPSALQRLADRVVTLPRQSNLADPAADRRRSDEETVRRILREYTRAYERMDVEAARVLWPSVDVRALQRAFGQLDGQQLRLGSCGVSFAGQAANARCQGDAVYRPKVGTRVMQVNGREWTFNLSRSHGGWQIVNAEIH